MRAIVISVLAVMLFGCGEKSQAENSGSTAQMNEIKMNRLAREKISATLKDPDSAQFRNQRGACGEVNAKNSFGGYTGFKRFMVGGELNVVDGDPRLADGAFDESWNMLCGPNGKLATMFVK